MDRPTAFRLKADVLLPLSVKSNGPAVLRAMAHFTAIACCAAVTWSLRASLWVLPSILLLAYLEAFMFNARHETAHQTAFRTRGLNYLVGHFAGFAMLLPYEYYRAFHWDHHRYTQNPELDPELASPLSPSRLGLTWYWLGPPIWRNRIRMLLRHSAGTVDERWVAPGNFQDYRFPEGNLRLIQLLTTGSVSGGPQIPNPVS